MRHAVLFLSLALHSVGISASPVTLSEVLDLVRQGHPDIEAADARVETARFEVEAVNWERYPSVTSTLETDNDSNDASLVTIEQPLWSGGQITAQIDLAKAARGVASADRGLTEFGLLERAVQRYFEVLRQQRRAVAARDNVQSHQRLLEAVQRRVQAQVTSLSEQVLAESRLASAQAELNDAQLELGNSLSQLSELLNQPVTKVADFSGPEWAPLDQNPIESALAFSPENRRLQAQVLEATKAAELASKRYWPTLVAGYQRRFDPPDGQDRERVYLAFRVSPGAGFSALSRARGASSEVKAAELSVETHRRELVQQVDRLVGEIDSRARQVTTQKKALTAALALTESYDRQFQVGKKAWLDVMNMQREKVQAERALIDVETQLQQARQQLRLLTGQLIQPMSSGNQ